MSTSTSGRPAGKSSIRGVLKDKRVQLAAAAAGILGVIVLLRRGGNSDAPAGDDTQNASGTYLQPAQYDSTGTDVYNAIQSIGTAWDNDLRGFTDQLSGIQDSLDKLGQAPPVTTPPPATTPPKTTPPKTTPKPAPAKPAASYVTVSKFTTASAARGSNWASTLSTIAGHYHTSVSNLLKLNPSIKNANLIHTGQKIRYK